MKNLIKYSLLVLLVSVVLTSCFEENLNPVPKTAISDLSAFDTRSRIVSQVRGIYAAFKSGQYLGGRYLVYNDIRSDDWLNLGQNGVTGLLTWNHTLANSTGEVQNLWGAIYASINRINMFVAGLDENQARLISQNIITQAEFNQFKGEALALRGLAYSHLMQLYAQPFNRNPQGLGAVLRLTPSISAADNNMARVTLQATYTQILKDLNDAEVLLPVIPATANSAAFVTQVHRGTVAAIKSRVYLHMNDMPNVRLEANKIVSAAAPFTSATGVQYRLASTFGSIFLTPYTTSESILSMPMSAAELPGTQNGLGHYFSASPVGNNEYPINTASVVWSSPAFLATDARKTLTETRVIGGVTQTFIRKYTMGPSHTDWVPVIRYAEVLLNLAEAEARIAWPSTRAVALLNEVYLRSNPGAAPLGGFASADAFVDRVMLERNMEFLGEGIRNMDTKRRVASHLAKPGVGAVAPTAPNYVWPIPLTELNTNLLVQPN